MSVVHIINRGLNTHLDGIAFGEDRVICNGSPLGEYQVFVFIGTGDGFYRIIHQVSGKEVMADNMNKVRLLQPAVSPWHHWRFETVSEGCQRIIHRQTNNILEAAPSGELILNAWSGSPSQVWTFAPYGAPPIGLPVQPMPVQPNPYIIPQQLPYGVPQQAPYVPQHNPYANPYANPQINSNVQPAVVNRQVSPQVVVVEKTRVVNNTDAEDAACCAGIAASLCCLGGCCLAILGMEAMSQ
ncbi:transcription elongation regulator 1 [Acrasis kona]|uniref:Transcription elongation regulator 1 n=1 Tax=Acrasis kona TaxID=1008807 RepID=A0AAW2Z0G3_9EUKA